MNYLAWKVSHKNINMFLTILAILIAIYGIYLAQNANNSEISFEIINDVNVLDVHKSVRNLTISFQGEDLQDRNLNLRIVTIRFKNSGNVHILQGDYDIDGIWGFQVRDGEVVEVRMVGSNCDYLMSNLNPRLFNPETVQFEKTIFEKGVYFTLEILVLHEKDKIPKIVPIGKIAGVNKILEISENKEQTIPTGTKIQFLIVGIALLSICIIGFIKSGRIIRVPIMKLDSELSSMLHEFNSNSSDIFTKINEIYKIKIKKDMLIMDFQNAFSLWVVTSIFFILIGSSHLVHIKSYFYPSSLLLLEFFSFLCLSWGAYYALRLFTVIKKLN